MFAGGEVCLEAGFAAARARLANLIHGSLLKDASQDACSGAVTGLARIGPLGSAPGVSRLAEVHFRDLVDHGERCLLTLRWEATGPGGRLFPALDADITLTPAGEHTTLLTLAGAYRPPLGAAGARIDQAILRLAATATIRTFTGRVATAITHPAGSAEPESASGYSQAPWPPPAPETP